MRLTYDGLKDSASWKKAGIELALSGEMLKAKPSTITSKWSEVCDKGSSLAKAVASGGTLKFKGPSFDICNSTDYRITINLNGSTIDATACDAAFTPHKPTRPTPRATAPNARPVLATPR